MNILKSFSTSATSTISGTLLSVCFAFSEKPYIIEVAGTFKSLFNGSGYSWTGVEVVKGVKMGVVKVFFMLLCLDLS